MISSVSLEAERELIDGALFYAHEANAELGLAFIAEFEHCLGVLCSHPRLGPVWRGNTRRFPLRRFHAASSIRSSPTKFGSSRLPIKAEDLVTGAVGSIALVPG